jgi:hypothetical protein
VQDTRTDEKKAPTVKAVLAEAKRLREHAERVRLTSDPWAKLYEPSDHTARKLSQQLGPENAILELRRRAADRQHDYRKECERAERARLRLERQQRLADAQRRQFLSGLTLGQRLDNALGALGVISETGAMTWGEERVSGNESDGSGIPHVEGARYVHFLERALRLVDKMESAVPRSGRRIGGRAA